MSNIKEIEAGIYYGNNNDREDLMFNIEFSNGDILHELDGKYILRVLNQLNDINKIDVTKKLISSVNQLTDLSIKYDLKIGNAVYAEINNIISNISAINDELNLLVQLNYKERNSINDRRR